MRILLKNGKFINVFTDELEHKNILIKDDKIIGVGEYEDWEADFVEDITGKIVCPGFIDGHIHIESTMLTPAELAKACLKHGTTAIIADPHEIANVSGINGINYMLEASDGLPMDTYIMIPSCVPATELDENGAILEAKDIYEFYKSDRVLGLGEMMNYPGVLNENNKVIKKIYDAHENGKIVNGHAPLLTGKELDQYISVGIHDDHECTSFDEAKERIQKGQKIMIRQGTAAKNLDSLLSLFDEPYSRRCLLVVDDKHPSDLLNEGHIDNIIRLAVKKGKSAITGIRMATIQAAEHFGLKGVGAIAPGYVADLVILDDLEKINIIDVYKKGKKVVDKEIVLKFEIPKINREIERSVFNTFNVGKLSAEDFYINPKQSKCRVIKVIPKQLLTDEWITELIFEKQNGIDVERDILKLAVVERHMNTGNIGVGYINGIGLKKGAIASSISHDSHNLIVIGTNDEDMAIAANKICSMGGGNVVVVNGEIIAEMPLPIAGLMSTESAEEVTVQNERVRAAVDMISSDNEIEPFMNMAFISLAVIPNLKMSTKGLVDVNKQELVSLFVDEE